MSTTMMIAQIVGPIYLAVALGMWVSADHYMKMIDEVMKSKGMMYYGGIMALAVGVAILRVHNMWVADWSVLVTLIGWAATIKGLGLLLVPEQFMDFSKSLMKGGFMSVAKVAALLLGLALTYVGYWM